MQGQAGVLRVASELLLRGVHVCAPFADGHGVDLVTESGVRIQVKSSHLGVYKRTPYGAYWFNFGKTVFATKVDAPKTHHKVKRNYSDQCDVVILWGIDDGEFWIIPANVVDGANGVVMGRQSQYRDFDIERAKQLRLDGLTDAAIADLMGTTRTTVLRRLRGQFLKPKRTLADSVRKGKDRWELVVELEQLRVRRPQGQLISMPTAEAVAS